MGKTVEDILNKYNNQPSISSVESIKNKYGVYSEPDKFKPESYQKRLFGEIKVSKNRKETTDEYNNRVRSMYDNLMNDYVKQNSVGQSDDFETAKRNMISSERLKSIDQDYIEKNRDSENAAFNKKRAKEHQDALKFQTENPDLAKEYNKKRLKLGYELDDTPTKKEVTEWLGKFDKYGNRVSFDKDGKELPKGLYDRTLAYENKSNKEEKPKKETKKKTESFGESLGFAFSPGLKLGSDSVKKAKEKSNGKPKQEDVIKEAFNEKDGIGRFSARLGDSATFGAIGELDKKLNGKEPEFRSERKFGKGKGTDLLADLTGFALPGAAEVKGANTALKGLKFLNGTSKLAKVGKIAAEGATTMGLHSLGQIGTREALNPKDYTLKDDAKLLGENVATGVLGDLALRGVGSLIGKGVGKLFTNKIATTAIEKLPIKAENNELYQSLSPEDRVQYVKNLLQPKREISVPELTKSKVPSNTTELKQQAYETLIPEQNIDNQLVKSVPENKKIYKIQQGLSKEEKIEKNELEYLFDKERSGHSEDEWKAYYGEKEFEDMTSRLQELRMKEKPIIIDRNHDWTPDDVKEVSDIIDNNKLSVKDKAKAKAELIVTTLSSKFKNKSAFKLWRETPDRVMEMVAGENADVLKKSYVEPVKVATTESIRFKNAIKDEFSTLQKDWNLSKDDDKLIQMYGEKLISEDELKTKTANWENVKKATDWYRNKYDDLLNKINDSLIKNGYDPIPKRKDYFPHFEDSDNFLKDIFGIDGKDNSLPTDINGLTDLFRPYKTYFGNAKQRLGEETSFGALQGFSQYLDGASNLIHHTDNLRNIRELENAIRTKYAGEKHLNNFAPWLKEWGNNVAGKKGKLDRGIEDFFGRPVYNAVKTLQTGLSKSLIAFNISPALTNFIPTVFATSETGKVAMSEALLETIQNIVKDDGFVNASDFLTRRKGYDSIYKTGFQKLTDKGYSLMQHIDDFNAQVIVRGKFNELVSKGVSEDVAMKQADEFAEKIMGDRSQGLSPLLFNQKVMGPITQFQLEVNNQLSHLTKDIPSMAKQMGKSKVGKVAHATSMLTQLAVFGWLFNENFEKVTGRRPAFDPIDYVNSFVKSLNGDEKATKVIEEIAGQLPFTSTIIEGRAPISTGIPNFSEALENANYYGDGSWKTTSKEVGKQTIKLGNVLIPGYAQMKKTSDAIQILNKKVPGAYTDTGKLKYTINNDPINATRGLLFGKGAFKETNEYYDKNGHYLSDKQTESVVNSKNPQKQYDIIQLTKKIKKAEEQKNKGELKRLNKQLNKLYNLK